MRSPTRSHTHHTMPVRRRNDPRHGPGPVTGPMPMHLPWACEVFHARRSPRHPTLVKLRHEDKRKLAILRQPRCEGKRRLQSGGRARATGRVEWRNTKRGRSPLSRRGRRCGRNAAFVGVALAASGGPLNPRAPRAPRLRPAPCRQRGGRPATPPPLPSASAKRVRRASPVACFASHAVGASSS